MKKAIVPLLLTVLGALSLYGQNMFVTEIPTIADLKVYEESSSVNADLIVYKATSPVYPGINSNEGIWYFVNNQTLANFTIFYVQSPVSADLKIYFTDIPTIAGWQNPNKKSLLNL